MIRPGLAAKKFVRRLFYQIGKVSQPKRLLQGVKKRKILGLLGGSRQDDVFGGAKAAVLLGFHPQPPINPVNESPRGGGLASLRPNKNT